MQAIKQQVTQSPWRSLLLVVLSPFLLSVLLMSLPLLVVVVPMGLVAYAAWSVLAIGRPVKKQRSVPVPGEVAQEKEGVPRRNIQTADELVSTMDGLTTIPQLMRATIEKFGDQNALGVRKLIKTVEKEVTVKQDGKDVVKKHKIPWMTDYQWCSFSELGQDITHFGAGLMHGTQAKLKFGDKVSIFASTRPEWQITAQAAFECGLVVVTVYPSLGPDALSFSLNQTGASHLICNASLMEIVVRSAGQLTDALKCVIYLDELTPTQVQTYQKALGREVLAWTDVKARGKALSGAGGAASSSSSSGAAGKIERPRAPKPQDLAVIMYTSGSTGQPKGVMMSHANVVAAAAGIGKVVPDSISEKDTYIAYLPLAHVLELTAELTVLAHGGCVGYSSPLTLRDDGVCDAQGKGAGDLGKLRPTLMAAVPLILDRLRAGVQEQVAKGPLVNRLLFKVAYWIKKRRYLAGSPSPLLDKLVFSKVAARFGGRVRYLLSGGAPLSGETHEFINITVCAPVMQGYGLTETMSGGCITHPEDRTTGNVGPPVACCQIKLTDENEMGYTSADKPKPRGQICIGGPNVTMGYFESDKQTEEAYFTDKDGVRYFRTGDIGQWEDDGTLKIIDRKKDLVKLSHGEYIAVGNLESKYAHCPLIDNICVVGDSHHGAPIALISPNHAKLKDLAASVGVASSDMEAICADPKVTKAVLDQLAAVAAQNKMEKWEKVAAVKLYPVAWTPDSGLLTEAMKLKRHEIGKRFKEDIDQLYQTVP